jgi:DNA-binding NarL/FixJ family response regulator
MVMIQILIVDDHAMVRAGLDQLLSTASDMTVIGQACDGLEALDQCQRLLPDIVLMDIVMPRMDGIRATSLIREQNPNIKIVILTAMCDEALIKPSILAGAEAVLTKNTSIGAILDTIRAVYESGQEQVCIQ